MPRTWSLRTVPTTVSACRSAIAAATSNVFSPAARQGLAYRELLEQCGIPAPTLCYWPSELCREEAAIAPRLVEVELLDDPAPVPITIDSRSGLRVTVAPGFDAEHLARVLKVLAQC